MAKGGAARRENAHEKTPESVAPANVGKSPRRGTRKTPVELDRIIHERVRLAIVSALAGAQSLSFNELKALLEITDGNLSVHARRLEEAGFITCEKSFVSRVPHTEFHITDAGRKALNEYLDHMESLIRRVREG